MPTKRKEKLVSVIKEKIQNAKIMILTEFAGLSVNQLQKIRSELRAINTEYKIVKNALIRLATKEAGLDHLAIDDIFTGSTAVVFGYTDEVSPAKVVKKLSKNFETLKIKGAIYEKDFLNKEKVEALTALSSKEDLLTRLLSILNSPLYGMLNVAQAKQREILFAFTAIAKQKTV